MDEYAEEFYKTKKDKEKDDGLSLWVIGLLNSFYNLSKIIISIIATYKQFTLIVFIFYNESFKTLVFTFET